MRKFFLHSKQLSFSKWQHKDTELAIELWTDNRVTKYFTKEPFTRKNAKAKLQREINLQATQGVQYWPIFLTATGEHVGVCGLRPYKLSEQIYEIGVHLRPKFWRKGLAREAMQAVLEYGVSVIKVKMFFAGHHPDNIDSHRLLVSLGFHYSHDEHYEPTGLQHPSYLLPATELTKPTQKMFTKEINGLFESRSQQTSNNCLLSSKNRTNLLSKV